MTPADDSGAGTAGRAETYLRLLAETELRRGIALPRYQPPGPPELPPPVYSALRAVAPVAAAAGQAARPLMPSARLAVTAVRPLGEQVVAALAPSARRAAQAWTPTARRAFLVSLRTGRRLARRHVGYGRAPAEKGVDRVRAVASALAEVQALDEQTAESIVAGLEAALAARRRIDHRQMLATGQTRRNRQPPRPGVPAGQWSATTVGAMVPLEADGQHGAILLISLVLAPDLAALGMVAKIPAALPGSPWAELFSECLHNARATDDRGVSYRLSIGGMIRGRGRGGRGAPIVQEGAYGFSPLPSAGVRWLDVTVPGGVATRIEVAAARTQDAERPRTLAPASPAERFLDATAESLLRRGAIRGTTAQHALAGLPNVVEAFSAAGVLTAGSPALRRLVTLARRLRLGIPRQLAGIQDTGLPEPWENVAAHRDRTDGPVGIAPLAAILPELDGVRYILTGLRSDERAATMYVLAWGWRQPHVLPPSRLFRGPWHQQFSWWARDDMGRWHIGREWGNTFGSGHSDLEVELTPPLHPAATSLDIILAGRTGEARSTVRLDWKAAP